MAVTQFNKGEVITLRAEFRTPKTAVPPSALFDPNMVTIRFQSPDKTVTTLTYGVNANVAQDAVGKYSVKYSLSQEGTYHWRWTGSNGTDAAGVINGSFDSRMEPNF